MGVDVWGNMVAAVRKFGFESIFCKYYSRYRGIVVDVDDPDNRCRIKVKVPSLFMDVVLANWAEPLVFADGGGLLGGISGKPSSTDGKFCGPFNPPKVDDWVWVEFEKGHASFPMYSCKSWFSDEDRIALFDDASDWNMMNPIFVSRFGHKIYVDESSGAAKFVIEMNSGNKFSVDDSDGGQMFEMLSASGSFWRMTTDDAGSVSDIEISATGGLTEEYGTDATRTFKAGLVDDITGDNSITVGGSATHEYKGGQTVTVGSDKSEDISGALSVKSSGVNFESSGDAVFKGTTQKIGAGGHPVPYGDTLKDALDAFADALSKLTPGAPPNNAQALAAIMQAGIQLKQGILMMNSKKTETD